MILLAAVAVDTAVTEGLKATSEVEVAVATAVMEVKEDMEPAEVEVATEKHLHQLKLTVPGAVIAEKDMEPAEVAQDTMTLLDMDTMDVSQSDG